MRPPVDPPEFRLSQAAPLTGSEGDPAVDPAIDAVAVLVTSTDAAGLDLGPDVVAVLEHLGVDGAALLRHHRATGAPGEVVAYPLLGPRAGAEVGPELLLVGVGNGSPGAVRRAGAVLARATRDRAHVVAYLGAHDTADAVEAFVVGATLGAFTFGWHRDGHGRRPPRLITLADLSEERRTALDHGRAVGLAGWRARALATTPANVKTPAWLAAQATEVTQEGDLSVQVWDERELVAMGFEGVVAVGRASAHPPRLIRLDYAPPTAGRRTPHVALVGKGVTFDTGGLSLKQGEDMKTMKRDMTGGGVVIAVMAALARLGCRVRVTGLVPAVENAIGAEAVRPGDVVRHYGGRTTEVTNTDAEGRLVLADAMAYAVAELAPDVLVDIATLTGASRVALGQRTGALFANDDGLATTLLEAARTAGEPLWRLPLARDYEEKLSSRIADADNGAGTPGAITAALFLQHFSGGLPWVHLDVASAADSPSEHFEWTEGPSGYGARLLLAWLRQPDPLRGVAPRAASRRTRRTERSARR